LFEKVAIKKAETKEAAIRVIANGRRVDLVFFFRVIGVPKPHGHLLLALYPQWYLSRKAIHSYA
jgi:hypothetical protein